MSQIVDYDNKNLEKLSVYARHLRPLLRESLIMEDEIDLNDVELSHYRLSKIREQDLKLCEEPAEYTKLTPGEGLGTAKAKDKKEEFISRIIIRLNELFITDGLTDKDLVNYARAVGDKVSENKAVMTQIANNTREQAMLGDFPKTVDDAVIDSGEAHRNQMTQLLSDPSKIAGFAKVVFDMLTLEFKERSYNKTRP